MTDSGHFQECFSGSGISQDDLACQDARLDDDTDVDQADFALFQQCLSGSNVPVDLTCAG